MSNTPADLHYASSHEWARLEEETITVGISDFAQSALGDVVYVELPAVDTEVAAGEEIAVVESVKAASDIYSPVSGKVVAVNEALEDAPELVNQDPYGAGWFFKVASSAGAEGAESAEVDNLLSAEDYSAHCEAEGNG